MLERRECINLYKVVGEGTAELNVQGWFGSTMTRSYQGMKRCNILTFDIITLPLLLVRDQASRTVSVPEAQH